MWPVAKKWAGGRAPNRMPSEVQEGILLVLLQGADRFKYRIVPHVNKPRGYETRLLVPLLISLMVCFHVLCGGKNKPKEKSPSPPKKNPCAKYKKDISLEKSLIRL